MNTIKVSEKLKALELDNQFDFLETSTKNAEMTFNVPDII